MVRMHAELSATPLEKEWRRLLETVLARGATSPERAPEERIDVDARHPGAVRAARAAWLARMVDEHRSATVFAGIFPQLVLASAPLDVQAVVLRMAIDEVRHGALCAGIVEALGGEASMEVAHPVEIVAVHAGETPLVAALRNVIYASCVTETVSVSLTTAERDHSTEPLVVRALDQLLGDEVLHARFGWLFLGWAWPRLSGEERRAVEAYVPFSLAHYRKIVLPRYGDPVGVPEAELADRAALGLGPGDLYREILEDTLDAVIVPRLREHGLSVSVA